MTTKNLLTYCVKSKDPPPRIYLQFLKRHGIQCMDLSEVIRITITEDEYLDKSCAFENMVKKFNFKVHPTEYNIIEHLVPDQIDACIITYVDDKSSHFHKFGCTVNNNGYDVTTTASDASHKNGIVQRPHQTFKEQM